MFKRKQAPSTVVITGASAGVGRALARIFAEDGARVGLLSRDPVRLHDAAEEVADLGGDALGVPLDVADAEAVEQAAQLVEEQFGPIDIWINNAMVSVFSPVQRMTAAEFRRVTEVTYLGQVNGTLSALRRMVPRNSGTIILVGSALAYRGIPLQAAYCAAKHAVKGFADSLRVELLREQSKVKLTSVHLPAINTPQFDWVKSRLAYRAQPVPPIFQPEVAARAIHWAAHHPRPEVLVGWPTLQAVLGSKLVPRFVDHYLARTGFSSQQTAQPEDPARADNLWETVSMNVGAHGRFDHRADSSSMQMWLNMHRTKLTIGAAAAIGAFALARRNGTERNGTHVQPRAVDGSEHGEQWVNQ